MVVSKEDQYKAPDFLNATDFAKKYSKTTKFVRAAFNFLHKMNVHVKNKHGNQDLVIVARRNTHNSYGLKAHPLHHDIVLQRIAKEEQIDAKKRTKGGER